VLRDGGSPAAAGAAAPAAPAEVLAYGGTFKPDGGHVEWVDARGIQSGFTTTFPPNTPVTYTTGGATYDVDFTSRREGKTATLPTYSAVTARSFHPGGVNALLVDGSVRFVANAVSRDTWRAAGTRAGGEVVGEF
jgi:prepilin-type processing-associated H-X9-DG protein